MHLTYHTQLRTRNSDIYQQTSALRVLPIRATSAVNLGNAGNRRFLRLCAFRGVLCVWGGAFSFLPLAQLLGDVER